MPTKKTASNKNEKANNDAANASSLENVTRNLRQTAQQAGEEVRKYMDTASVQLDGATKDIKKAIRKEPLKSTALAAGVAAAVGFIAGAFTRRK